MSTSAPDFSELRVWLLGTAGLSERQYTHCLPALNEMLVESVADLEFLSRTLHFDEVFIGVTAPRVREALAAESARGCLTDATPATSARPAALADNSQKGRRSSPAASSTHLVVQAVEVSENEDPSHDVDAVVVVATPVREKKRPSEGLTAAEARAQAAREGLVFVTSSTSENGFHGVTFDRRKSLPYDAHIGQKTKGSFIGSFASAEEAALAVARHTGNTIERCVQAPGHSQGSRDALAKGRDALAKKRRKLCTVEIEAVECGSSVGVDTSTVDAVVVAHVDVGHLTGEEAIAQAECEGLVLVRSDHHASGYQGVKIDNRLGKTRKPYSAYMYANPGSKQRFLGSFATPEQAALVYARHAPDTPAVRKGYSAGSVAARLEIHTFTLVCERPGCDALVDLRCAKTAAKTAGRIAFVAGDGCGNRLCSRRLKDWRAYRFSVQQLKMAGQLQRGERKLIRWPADKEDKQLCLMPSSAAQDVAAGAIASAPAVLAPAAASAPTAVLVPAVTLAAVAVSDPAAASASAAVLAVLAPTDMPAPKNGMSRPRRRAAEANQSARQLHENDEDKEEEHEDTAEPAECGTSVITR